jgi:AraC-like DNA-binding protein
MILLHGITARSTAARLAVRYLDDPKLHVSKIAWLLGFHDVSAFTHAFKRGTGKTPSQIRTAGAYESKCHGLRKPSKP